MTGDTRSRRSASDRSDGLPGHRHRLTRYDLVLAVVPAAFLAGVLVASLADVPLRVAMGGAAGISALALVDGLFVNPPRRPSVGDGGDSP